MLPDQQKHKVSEALRKLGYDFNHFVLNDFLAHIEKQRQKPIHVEDFSFDYLDVSGAWISTPEIDYILVSDTAHSVHRAHIILHELAHIVLGHTRQPTRNFLPARPSHALRFQDAEGRARRADAHSDTPEEREAEEFVFQIQDLVSEANRLHELIEIGTSIEALRPVINSAAS